MKRVRETVHALTEREPGFPADGIDLEFYHFLCHKSPRLWSLRFDQCQHFCISALLKCFTLIVWGMVIFTPKKLKSSIFSLLHEATSCIDADLKAVGQMGLDQHILWPQKVILKIVILFVSDPPPQHTEVMHGFPRILCEAETWDLVCGSQTTLIIARIS